MKKTVAKIGLKVDFSKPLSEVTVNLPECTEILSAHIEDNKEGLLHLVFIAPTNMFESHLWKEYIFVIVKANYTVFDFDNHKYVDSINIGNDTFAIFYKTGLIESNNL